jgi:hypothetical protein
MISALAFVLLYVAALVVIAGLAIALSGSAIATRAIYGATLLGALIAMAVLATRFASEPDAVSALGLPIGLPWLGAHFRLLSIWGARRRASMAWDMAAMSPSRIASCRSSRPSSRG